MPSVPVMNRADRNLLLRSNFGRRRNTVTTYSPSDSWDGGPFLRVTMNGVTGQNDSGIGIPLNSLDLVGGHHMGWISRHGPDWLTGGLVGTPKMYLERLIDGTGTIAHSQSPMVAEVGAHTPVDYHVPQLSSNPASGGRQDEYGNTYPQDADDDYSFRYEDYIGEWVYYEVSHVYGSSLTLSIYTRDGLIASRDLVSSTSEATPDLQLGEFRMVAYTENDGSASADTYIDVADLFVSDSFMGPPPGFVLP